MSPARRVGAGRGREAEGPLAADRVLAAADGDALPAGPRGGDGVQRQLGQVSAHPGRGRRRLLPEADHPLRGSRPPADAAGLGQGRAGGARDDARAAGAVGGAAVRGAAARCGPDGQRRPALDGRRAAPVPARRAGQGHPRPLRRPPARRRAQADPQPPGPRSLPAGLRPGDGSDGAPARPGHDDGERLRGHLRAGRGRGPAADAGAGRRSDSVARAAAGGDPSVPAGAADRVPGSGGRRRRRRLPGHSGDDRGGLRWAFRRRPRARACRRPSTCPRPTPT